MNPSDQEALLDLLSQWDAGRDARTPLDPRELCANRPDLLPELLAVIRAQEVLTRPDPADERPPPPVSLGGYRITRKLGGGSMGVVYSAHDPTLGREVAVKVMRADAVRTGSTSRFLREARAAAAIQNDHVVSVYAVGEENGGPCIVMPLLAGESLSVRLERDGRLTPREVTALGRDAAEGLAAAHARGLVHRDIKPSNLWLEPTGDGFRLKVLDFGLAWSADDSDLRLTGSGAVLGTPCYMSPEQTEGRAPEPRGDCSRSGPCCTRRSPARPRSAARTTRRRCGRSASTTHARRTNSSLVFRSSFRHS